MKGFAFGVSTGALGNFRKPGASAGGYVDADPMAAEAQGGYSLFLGFVSGGAASCVATAATNPIDVMKVDLQLSKKSILQAVRDRARHGT